MVFKDKKLINNYMSNFDFFTLNQAEKKICIFNLTEKYLYNELVISLSINPRTGKEYIINRISN